MTLADGFHNELLDMYRQVVDECPPFNPTRFLNLVGDLGGLVAAKQLLSMELAQSGLTELWMRKRLDLTMECRVLIPKYRELFTQPELEEARRRLREYGMEMDQE